MTKAPLPTEMSKGLRDSTKTSPKSSFTQRTDLTTVTQPVWFTGFTGPTFPLTATAVYSRQEHASTTLQ